MKLSVESCTYSPCSTCNCPKWYEAMCGINYRQGD